MSSVVNLAAKFTKDLNQRNEKNYAKKDEI